MSDDPTCWHRWDSDTTDPGPCQCVRDGGHDGPHLCCCGATDE